MAEECPRKAFNLVSSLGVLKQELEKGFADEASVQADMAKSATHELMEEGCISEEKHQEIEDELTRVGFLSTMKKVEEAEKEFEPIREKVEEVDLVEMARKGAPEWLK